MIVADQLEKKVKYFCHDEFYHVFFELYTSKIRFFYVRSMTSFDCLWLLLLVLQGFIYLNTVYNLNLLYNINFIVERLINIISKSY